MTARARPASDDGPHNNGGRGPFSQTRHEIRRTASLARRFAVSHFFPFGVYTTMNLNPPLSTTRLISSTPPIPTTQPQSARRHSLRTSERDDAESPEDTWSGHDSGDEGAGADAEPKAQSSNGLKRKRPNTVSYVPSRAVLFVCWHRATDRAFLGDQMD